MLRRSLLQGILAMPFGTARTRGFNNPIATNFAAGNIRINKFGFFIYNGTPAANNLLFSDLSGVVFYTDPFGNNVPFGQTNYASNAGLPGVATGVGFNGAQEFLLNSAGTGSQQGSWSLSSYFYQTATVWSSSTPLAAQQPGSPNRTPEVWHSLGAVAGTGCTVLQARYELSPDGNFCVIDIALLAAAGGSIAGTYTFANTLPAAYQSPLAGLRIYPLPFNAAITTATQNSIIAVDGTGGGVPGRVRITIPAIAAGAFFSGTCFMPIT
jgi:hypothetical protein